MKKAILTGLIIGVLSGTIDLIVRISTLSFEGFEIYQIFLFSILIYTLGFTCLGIIAKLITKKDLTHFYISTGIVILFLIHFGLLINVNTYSQTGHMSKLGSLLIFIISGLLYILLLSCKEIIKNVVEYFKKKGIHRIMYNYIFIIFLIILFGLFVDLYTLNKVPEINNKIDSPNIVFITLDTVRADHINEETSPNLMKLAKDSVVFNNAISPSSWTLPAHASIFTGKYPSEHNANKRHLFLNRNETTLAELLKSNGYNTAGFVGGAYCKAKRGIGQGFNYYLDRLDFFEYGQTNQYANIRVIIDRITRDLHRNIFKIDEEKTSYEINKDVFKWLDKNDKSTFFMFINYFDAHGEHNLGETEQKFEYSEVKKMFSIKEPYDEINKEVLNYTLELYDSEIKYMDNNLGILFERLNQIDNTIIIITSDHGEEFYDNGFFNHGYTLYNEVIHVPLIIYYPNKLKAEEINNTVGTINLFQTILKMADVTFETETNDLLSGEYEKYIYSELLGRTEYPELGENEVKSITTDNYQLLKVNGENEIIQKRIH